MKIAVLGAGTMGHALALVFALGGHRIRLTDNDPGTLSRAPALMDGALDTLREAGEAGPEWTSSRLAEAVSRHETTAETVEGVDLVVEAIVERPDAKRALFAELDDLLEPNVIIASNTSYLDVFPLIPERRLSRSLIAHWYTPPYLVDLVDIVGNSRTEPSVIATVRDMVAAMGKAPVVMRKFIPGYIANRIQSAIGLEVQRLVDEGYATPSDIDEAVIYGLALRMPVLGIMAKADFTGIGLLRDALRNKTYEPPPATTSSPTLDKLVADGRLGVLSGKGYFDWSAQSPEALFRERDRKLLALKKAFREIGRMEGK